MAATYSLKVGKTVTPSIVNTVVTTDDDPRRAKIPATDPVYEFATGTGAGQINKLGWGTLSLAVSTPVTLDLTAISGMTTWTGDTAFAKVKYLKIINGATAGGTKPLIVGVAASNAFNGQMGGTTPTETVEAGCELEWENKEAGGWTVDSTHKNVKVNPGANAIVLTIIIAGN